MLPAANVMAQRRRRGSGGGIRVAAVVLLLPLLALCLARADAAASLAGRRAEKRVASALESARAQEVERGHYTTLATAAAEEEDDEEPAVLERVDLEQIQDYYTIANPRHNPKPNP